jgi:Putative metal-binding motif
VLAVALTVVPSAFALSGNDNRASAFTLTPDTASVLDTTGNTVEVGEPNIFSSGAGCAQSFNHRLGATAWYKVTGTGGPLTITTDELVLGTTTATAIDTLIFVYPQGSNTYTVCNDDIAPGSNTHSAVTFNSTAGQVYEVQVGQFTASTTTNPGGGQIVTALRPVNDSRSFPTRIQSGVPITGSNRYAALPAEAGEPLTCKPTPTSGAVPYSRTVWFKFTAPSAGTAIIRTNGGLDTVEAVYAGNSTTPVACNDDFPGLVGPSGVTIPVAAGDYLIQVGGFGNPTPDTKRGAWTQTVDFTATPPPPPNHDVDGDGFIGSQFGGPDCNDSNAAIHPGANDIPKNGIDENCDGQDAKHPALKVSANLTTLFFKKFTKITKAPVSVSPAGGKLVLKCSSKKKGCGKLKSKTISVKSTKSISLLKYLKKLKLKKNAKITVTATKSGYIGVQTVFTIRLLHIPRKQTFCLDPGSKKPKKLGTCS